MSRKSPAYRLVLLGIVAVLVGGAAFGGYYLYTQSQEQARLPAEAEQAYREGKQSLESGASAQALESFKKSLLLTDKALANIDEEKKKGQGSAGELDERRGKLLYVRAMAMRDKNFAAAALDGSPLRETDDSTTLEKFRAVVAIIERSPEDFNAARLALREAAYLLPRDLAAQQDALKVEMMLAPQDQDVGLIERLCRRIIDLEPVNVRANSYLARVEFDQPSETTGKPAAEKDKNRERILAAREHLQAVKKAPYYPIWRTLDLEAQIQLWLARRGSAAGAKEKGQEEEKRLRDLLFDPADGILARAGRKEGFTALSKPDVTGLRDLHLLAVRFGIDQARNSMGSQSDDLFNALRAEEQLANNLFDSEYGKPYRAAVLRDCMEAATLARRYLGSQTPEDWPAIREGLEKVARRAADAGVSSPAAYALLAQLLNNDGFLEGKRGNAAARKELETRALSWVDEGLKVGREAGETGANLVELYGVGVEILLAQGAPEKEVARFLEALKKVNDPRANAIVGVQEAALLVRQGKFALAKAAIEKLLKNDKAADFRPRALTLLANVYLSTRDPVNALSTLEELDRSYGKADKLSAMERAFMLEFLLDPRDIAQLMVTAELETALEKLDLYRRENPLRVNSPDPGIQFTVQNHEEKARKSLARLANGTDANRRARIAFANYYLRRGLYSQAREEVKKLRDDYPASTDALRVEVALALLPDPNVRDDATEAARRRKQADALIQAHLTGNPADTASKLFWAEWLIRTGRNDEALAYLEDPKNFPGERDESAKRMLALAMLNSGSRDEGVRLLEKLPRDRTIEALLIQTSANPEVRQQMLNEAMDKYENNGSFRVLQGQKLISQDKFAEAAEAFWQAREFSGVRDAAAAGLLRSLLLLAESDPDKALDTVERFIKEAPAEPVLFGVAAFALMKKDEFGTPADVWSRNKTMYGALNAWAGLSKGLDAAEKALFMARFWIQANQPRQAWNLLSAVATERKPYNEAALATLVEVAMLLPDDREVASRARDYLALLKEMQPEAAWVRLLDARFAAARGDLARAVTVLEGVLERNPKYVAAYPEIIRMLNDLGQPKKAAEWTTAWLKVAPDNPVAEVEQVRQMLVAGKAGDAADAAEAFVIGVEDRLRKRMPKTTDADLNRINNERVRAARAAAELALAQAWQQAGDLDGAAKWLDRSLKDDPKVQAARLFEAQLALARQDWAKAKEVYEAVLKEDKNNYVAKTNLAWLLAVHLDKTEEGLRMIRTEMNSPFSGRPVAYDRFNPEFLNVLGSILAQASRKKVDPDAPAQMKEIFESASRRYPSDPRVFLHLGEAFDDLDEKGKAAVAYQQALKLAQEGKGPLTAEQRRDLIKTVSERLKGL